MKRSLRLFFPLSILALSPFALEAEDLFKGATHGDFYFDFLEEADEEEVFELPGDGTLLIKGEGNPDGYLQTLDPYSDYELEFEWRWPGEPGNSGVQIHSSSTPAWSIWPESIEIQLQDGNVGDFWLLNTSLEVEESQMPKKASERDRRHRLKTDRDSRKGKEKKPGEWNKMRIIAKEDTVTVFLNGAKVNEGTSASVSEGFITLQAEGADIEFRNFRIQELDTEQ